MTFSETNSMKRTENLMVSPKHVLRPEDPRITVLDIDGERVFKVYPTLHSRGSVLLVHGLTDHPGRHFHTAMKLAREGFHVTLFELAGHGGNGQPLINAWPVYQAYAEHTEPSTVQSILAGNRSLKSKRDVNKIQYEILRRFQLAGHVRQVERVLELHAQSAVADEPLFLAGFSMGGLIVAQSVLRRAQNKLKSLDLRGAIFLSPAFRPQGRPGHLFQTVFVDFLWAMRNSIFPFPRLAVKKAFNLNFPLDASWGIPYMSDLPDEISLYGADPLISTILPSAYLSSIETQMARTFDGARHFPVDALFLVPGSDGITSVSGGLSFASRVAASLGSHRCTTARYESVAAHDLTRSSVAQEVHNNMLSWMSERLA